MESPWDRRLGFWWIAEDQPDAAAILESPDGPRTYGELAGDAHQLVHLWRSMGIEPGDVVAALVDNGNTLIECALATHEAGLQFTPLNTHLTAHELTTIMDHSGCKVLVAGARFAPLLAGLDRRRVGAARADGRRSRRLRVARVGPPRMPRSAPDDRRPGSLFVYTSGTTGRPKGIRRPIPPGDPDLLANAERGLRPCLRLPSVRRSDARQHRHVSRWIAQLLHGRSQRRPRARDHGPLRTRAHSATHRAVPRPHRLHGADAVPPSPAAAARGARAVRPLEPALRRPLRRTVPGRGQGADDGVVGPGDLGDLRRHGGRGHDRQAASLAREARDRRPIDPRRSAD